MKDLEKFKFATIKNVSIKVQELNDKIEIRIETLDKTKEIEIYYKPLDGNDFQISDNHQSIAVDRAYQIGTPDGDVDWEQERIYPCQTCDNRLISLREEETKTKKLSDRIDILFDFLKEKIKQ